MLFNTHRHSICKDGTPPACSATSTLTVLNHLSLLILFQLITNISFIKLKRLKEYIKRLKEYIKTGQLCKCTNLKTCKWTMESSLVLLLMLLRLCGSGAEGLGGDLSEMRAAGLWRRLRKCCWRIECLWPLGEEHRGWIENSKSQVDELKAELIITSVYIKQLQRETPSSDFSNGWLVMLFSFSALMCLF